jgi:hypothetical protein
MSQRSGRHGHVTRSGFERRGGYPSPETPVRVLPKVPAGPAPGAVADTRPPPVTEEADRTAP